MPGAFALFAFLLAGVAIVHARDILITVDNPNILWNSDNRAPLSSSKCSVDLSFNEQCTDNWWFTSGNTEVATWGSSVSMSFDFEGDSIEIGVEIFPGGGAFFAKVDGFEMQPEGYSTDADEASTAQFPIGANLDPRQSPHTVIIEYDSQYFSADPDARSFIAILGFVVRGAPASGTTGSTTDFDDGTNTDQTGDTQGSNAPDGTTGTTGTGNTNGGGGFQAGGNGNGGNGVGSAADQTPSQSPEVPNKPLSPGAIGGLLGVIFFAALLAGITEAIYILRQRRLRRLPTARLITDGQGSLEANVGIGATRKGSVDSSVFDEKVAPAEASVPRRPDTRVSSLYPPGMEDSALTVSVPNLSRGY